MAWIQPLHIGSTRLNNNLALAPMAGTSEIVFRGLCRAFGAGLTVTELVSARGICYDHDFKRSWRYIEIDPLEDPSAIQLFGSEPDDFKKALTLIFEHPILSQCAMIDLNMGCPVAKVVNHGDGCALMLNPERAHEIIKTCARVAEQAGKPVTVKFRKGWDDEHVNAESFASMCEQAGAAAVTVHGRTRQQMYSGKADWSIIKRVKQTVSIPVYGNGDVCSGRSALRMLVETGADGIMIARAAQGNPWIFSQITSYLRQASSVDCSELEDRFSSQRCDSGKRTQFSAAINEEINQVSPDDKLSIIKQHLDGLIARYDEATAVREMRGQVAAYLKGSRHGGKYRALAVQAKTRDDMLSVLEDWRFYCRKSCENS